MDAGALERASIVEMHPIAPHLWFDKEAQEAAGFYVSLFPGSKITNITRLNDTPSGDPDVVSFELAGQPFMAISAGPLFKFNPSVSFLTRFKTEDAVDQAYEKLSDAGTVMMPLASYPFSKRYAWVQDRYGISWQLMFAGEDEIKQTITPVMMFTGSESGKAEEAIRFYASVFKDSDVNILARYGRGEAPDKEGSVKHASFQLLGRQFAAMDSARVQNAAFNEAISLVVPCDTQDEIDDYWNKLSADPKAGQCGWLKDKYGFSWQITPAMMSEVLRSGNPEGIARVTRAFLKMKKFDIAALVQAFQGV